MRTKQTKPSEFAIMVKLWTLHDKERPMFRARNPDQHIVEIWADNRIGIRTFIFDKPADAEAHFQHLKSMFSRKGK